MEKDKDLQDRAIYKEIEIFPEKKLILTKVQKKRVKKYFNQLLKLGEFKA